MYWAEQVDGREQFVRVGLSEDEALALRAACFERGKRLVSCGVEPILDSCVVMTVDAAPDVSNFELSVSRADFELLPGVLYAFVDAEREFDDDGHVLRGRSKEAIEANAFKLYAELEGANLALQTGFHVQLAQFMIEAAQNNS